MKQSSITGSNSALESPVSTSKLKIFLDFLKVLDGMEKNSEFRLSIYLLKENRWMNGRWFIKRELNQQSNQILKNKTFTANNSLIFWMSDEEKNVSFSTWNLAICKNNTKQTY